MNDRPERSCRLRSWTALTLILAIFVISTALWRVTPAAPVHAAGTVNWTYRNFTMASYNQYDLYNSESALQQLVSAGATSVTFTVTWYTSSIYSTDISRTEATADDSALVFAIGQAQSLGLQVMLKPHLDSQDGQWRALINPGATAADQWFSNYTTFLDRYADIGAQHNAIMLCVGAELITMSTNPAYEWRWRALIAHERTRFGGKLTYSANWGGSDFAEEWSRLPFWDSLDYLGISAYFPLSNTTTPTVASLNDSWASIKINQIAPFQARWNKPLLFTEGGYRSMDGASIHPWDSNNFTGSDPQEQSDCYESLFETWGNVGWFAGGMFWFWKPDANADPNDADYEVQNKLAYNTVGLWFKSTAPVSTPTATLTLTPVPTATFTPVSTATPTPQPPSPTLTRTPPTVTPTPMIPVPRMLSVINGSTQGGTRITITGMNFVPGATVHFGSVPAAVYETQGTTTLTVISPAHAEGTVDVTVTNPDGQSARLAHAFTFVPPGFVSSPGAHITAATTAATPNRSPATHEAVSTPHITTIAPHA